MSKQQQIRYDRSNDQIEVASIHPDDLQSAQSQIVTCLKGMDIVFMGMFGTLYLDSKLSDEDILMINLSMSGNYEIVADNQGLSATIYE